MGTLQRMVGCWVGLLLLPLALSSTQTAEYPATGGQQMVAAEKKSLQLQVLEGTPQLGEAWKQTLDPQFILVREEPDKRSLIKRGLAITRNLDVLRQHYQGARGKKWTTVTNNMRLLREHNARRIDRLYMEVARRDTDSTMDNGLAELGKWDVGCTVQG